MHRPPVVRMIDFVHAETTLNNDTLPVWPDYNLVFPIGVLIRYEAACE